MRKIKFNYIFQHDETGRICSITFDYTQIFNGECKQQCERLTGYAVIAKRQFTGLKDKNGNGIYEYDILMDKISGVKWTVKFGNCKNYAFCGWYVENEIIGRTTQLYGDYNGDTNSMVEIIGNIYENPELISKSPPPTPQK